MSKIEKIFGSGIKFNSIFILNILQTIDIKINISFVFCKLAVSKEWFLELWNICFKY